MQTTSNLFYFDVNHGIGAPINALNDNDKCTPLHYAAHAGHVSTVEFLIDHGADGSVQNARGKTAYDVASKASLRQYLLKFLYASQAQTEEQAQALLAAPPAPDGQVCGWNS